MRTALSVVLGTGSVLLVGATFLLWQKEFLLTREGRVSSGLALAVFVAVVGFFTAWIAWTMDPPRESLLLQDDNAGLEVLLAVFFAVQILWLGLMKVRITRVGVQVPSKVPLYVLLAANVVMVVFMLVTAATEDNCRWYVIVSLLCFAVMPVGYDCFLWAPRLIGEAP